MPGLRKRTRPHSSRCRTKAGGDQYGQNLRSASYTPNSLNQYTSRTVPGGFDVVGVANNAATVRVDGSDVQYRRGEYWRQYVSVDNAGMPVWRSVSVTTTGGGSATGSVFIPKTAEAFGYDLDGNLTSDGRWTYVWDGENRLIQMTANTTVGPQQRIDFEYDWQGRRIGKKVWDNTQGTGNPSLTRKFLYDGWNLIAELDGNNTLVRSYVWGLDVSGSTQGAGGVGGLLMVKDAANGTHFAAYDLNGNVMGLVNAANGTISAQYEYGPFGEVVRMTGSMAKSNPFRFSTKYQDDETDLLYYGYRYYNASTGRWLSRDPIGEKGGMNLYGFVENEPCNKFDARGLLANTFVFRPTVKPSNGFEVEYIPPSACTCPAGNIRLVQAVQFTGNGIGAIWAHGSRFDTDYGTDGKNEANKSSIEAGTGPLPYPAYTDDKSAGGGNGMKGTHGKLSYIDAPDFSGNPGTWTFETCALCNRKGGSHNEILGCVTFTWTIETMNGTGKLNVTGGVPGKSGEIYGAPSATSGDTFNSAANNWNAE